MSFQPENYGPRSSSGGWKVGSSRKEGLWGDADKAWGREEEGGDTQNQQGWEKNEKGWVGRKVSTPQF